MSVESLKGPLRIEGRLTPEQLDIPDGTVDDAAVSDSADIQAHKMRHQHSMPFAVGESDDFVSGASTTQRTIHVAHAVGTIETLKLGLIVACAGDSTVTIDLYKNGATVLSSTVELSASQTAREVVEATIDPAKDALAAGDVLEIVVDGTVGTGAIGKGLFGLLVTREKAS